jgi:hypothetical protein
MQWLEQIRKSEAALKTAWESYLKIKAELKEMEE